MSLNKIRNAGIVGLAGALLFLILLFGLEMFLHQLSIRPIVDADTFLPLLTLSFVISFVLYLWAVRAKDVEFGVVLWRSKHKVRFLGTEITAWVFWPLVVVLLAAFVLSVRQVLVN
ncbi:MAG TPA: hypothetical protein VEK15_05330 [Vicinamibacteria bacterium]|nr:hypothetical protein [Vicinamibacteria bacterium]